MNYREVWVAVCGVTKPYTKVQDFKEFQGLSSIFVWKFVWEVTGSCMGRHQLHLLVLRVTGKYGQPFVAL